ncbi:alpha/beta hydrolase [Bifidobacterium sp. ESL0690]|uniref:alpha/beta hydrolase n=1 Tax=Bifidobacterium sp. ESL0690 TaxID=2983214 RepID=UPI0023F7DCBA|nr:alpha/beta hydrolase [Bifidobacterium sp. ESL0690]WEV47580.1 alpha/beta hydrolase [Bifidobacterium sp. ESL0690]
MTGTGLKIDDDERKILQTWTQLDEDLADCDPKLADAVLSTRLGMGRGDMPRNSYWQDPEGIDVIADIPYCGSADQIRGHKLDLYLPHDAVVRAGKSLPVYIDIHGGGFVYGYKELNRNFNTHLAAEGFAVFSLNYRPMPQTDFLGQLADIEAAFAWISAHLDDYPVDRNSIFITGDSAGGTLGLYSTAIERSETMAEALGIKRTGLNIKGAVYISGLFDIAAYTPGAQQNPITSEKADTSTLSTIAPSFFGPLIKKAGDWTNLDYLCRNVDLPPLFLNTSNDDFIQTETMKLSTVLSAHGRDFYLNNPHTQPGETLGHVYPVCMTWLEESAAALQKIRDFSYRQL